MVRIQKSIRVNERIRVPEVRVIGPNSEQLGVLMIRRALDMALEHGLDLVEVAPTVKPPVCRIMDFSKYKYDQEKKERKAKKHQHISHLKQIRVKPHIAIAIPDETNRDGNAKLAAPYLRTHRFPEPRWLDSKLELADRPLHAEQESIVG